VVFAEGPDRPKPVVFMKRTRVHRFLILTALLHLCADVALAGGGVLCVGPDDHQEIEFGHFGSDCGSLKGAELMERSAEFAFGVRPALEIGAEDCADCTDRPLHGEAEFVSPDVSWDPTSLAGLMIRIQTAPVPLRFGGQLLERRIGLTPTARALRTTILII
jgi:hypothetical protein